MKAVVVLAGCEYEENMGMVSRAMKNFGLSELRLVSPKAAKNSGKARSRAMHAQDVLRKAKTYRSLGSALKGADYSIAATAVTSKRAGGKRKALSPEQLSARFRDTNATLALVFGRESTGLSNREIDECDFIVTIPTSRKYSSMNLSHACAVLLYELFGKKGRPLFKAAKGSTKGAAVKKFGELAEALPAIRDKKEVSSSFKHIVSRAPATEKELNAVTGVLAESLKKIKKGCRQ